MLRRDRAMRNAVSVSSSSMFRSSARSPPCSLQPIQPSAALTENAGVEPGPGRRPHLFSGIPLPASPLTPDAVRCIEPSPTAIHRYGSISLILRFFKDIPSHPVWPTFRMDADRCRGAHEHLPRKGVPGKLAGWGDMNAPQLAQEIPSTRDVS